jgi:hypothetical protein
MATGTASALIERAEARARHDPAFAQVLAAVVDAPTSSAGSYRAAAARELNDRRLADALDAFLGGALKTADIQRRLGYATPQAVHRLRSRGRLVGLQRGNATWFPAWQLAGGGLRPDLPRLLDLLARFTDDVVAQDRVMRLERDELGGASIAAALDDAERAPSAWAILTALAG